MVMMDRSSIPQSFSHMNNGFMQTFTPACTFIPPSMSLIISSDHGQFLNLFILSKHNDTFLSDQFSNLSCEVPCQL